MTDDYSRQIDNASKLGAIDERTKHTDETVKNIERKLDEMGSTFVTKAVFRTWQMAVFGIFSAAFIALMWALFSGALRFHS